MYDLIYTFILQNIFNSQLLESYTSTVLGQTINLNVYLSHTFSILFMITLLVLAFVFLKWLFRLVSGLILLK